MKKAPDQMKFFSELSERLTTTNEFFGVVLLDSIDRNFGLKNLVISFFDPEGNFLSWVDKKGLLLNSKTHPYNSFQPNDVVRHIIYQKSVKEQLTYFNVEPRLYRSKELINSFDYDNSQYVLFLEENFNAHYSITLAFGINAYIQIKFFNTFDQGDFTKEDIHLFEEIYVFVANSYSNFKKHEQAKIISETKNKIISIGAKAFLITDDFRHILSLNDCAKEYITDIFGDAINCDLELNEECHWLSMIMPSKKEQLNGVVKKTIKNYVFEIHIHDQTYSNKIIDRYYWITISKKEDNSQINHVTQNLQLTITERKIVELMYKGLTYKSIASDLVISYHTVKKHIENIYKKLNVNSRYELYSWLDQHNKN